MWVQPLDCPRCGKTLELGLAQISVGLAWWYRRYADEQSAGDGGRYKSEEEEARLRKRGLWADEAPVPPWELRKGRPHEELTGRSRSGHEPPCSPRTASAWSCGLVLLVHTCDLVGQAPRGMFPTYAPSTNVSPVQDSTRLPNDQHRLASANGALLFHPALQFLRGNRRTDVIALR